MKIEKMLKTALPFKIVYFIFVLASFLSVCSHQKYLTYSAYAVTLVGVFFLAYRFLHYKHYYKTKGIIFLILFVVSYILSSLITMKLGYRENILTCIWMVLQFFLLYTYDIAQEQEDIRKEFHFFTKVFIFYTMLVVAGSLILFALQYGHESIVNGYVVRMGYVNHRLWGLYISPNYGAVFSLISSILSVYYIQKSRYLAFKIGLGFNIVLQFVYIALSDSRTCLVSLVAAVIILVFLLWRNKNHSGFLKKYFAPIFLSIAIILPSIGSFYGIQKAVNIFASISSEEELDVGDRSEDLSADVSNGRMDIWKSAIDIFKTSPITGVSYRNIVPYAKEYVSQTYIINTYKVYDDMHNVVLDILVSQGAIGILLILAFFIVLLFNIIKGVAMWGKAHIEISIMCSCIVSIIILSLLNPGFLYNNGISTFLFWLFLGYIVQFLQIEENKN